MGDTTAEEQRKRKERVAVGERPEQMVVRELGSWGAGELGRQAIGACKRRSFQARSNSKRRV